MISGWVKTIDWQTSVLCDPALESELLSNDFIGTIYHILLALVALIVKLSNGMAMEWQLHNDNTCMENITHVDHPFNDTIT